MGAFEWVMLAVVVAFVLLVLFAVFAVVAVGIAGRRGWKYTKDAKGLIVLAFFVVIGVVVWSAWAKYGASAAWYSFAAVVFVGVVVRNSARGMLRIYDKRSGARSL